MSLDTDIDAMLAAMPDSAPIVVGGVTGVGVMDLVDASMLERVAGVLGEQRELVYRTSAFPSLASGVAITFDGDAYKAADAPRREGDGRISRIAVRSA